MNERKYHAFLYKQKQESTMKIVTFVCNNGEIVKWAGVPRKAEETISKGVKQGFQRELSGSRIEEIATYFSETSNISPTAIVVAFRENSVSIEELQDFSSDDNVLKLCEIKIQEQDYSEKNTIDLIEEVISDFSLRYEEEALEDNGNQDDEVFVISEEGKDDSSSNNYNILLDEEEFVPYDSHLREFLDKLEQFKEILSNGQELPKHVLKEDLRETCISLLMPAMLVDGQHRVHGSLHEKENIPFTVCGIIDADWSEQVFQFVILNQKSVPISQAFLSSIIATSLTQSEVVCLRNRLLKSGVPIGIIEAMDKINSFSESPFYKMIKYEVPGETGLLPYTGMSRLASSFKKLGPGNKRYLISDKILEEWNIKKNQELGLWLDYFLVFWGAIKAKYEITPENDLPLWDLQENKDSQLLRIVTMNIIQELFIEYLQISRLNIQENIEEFGELVAEWIDVVHRDFFSIKWQGVKSLPKDGKDTLKRVLGESLKNPNYVFKNTILFRKY